MNTQMNNMMSGKIRTYLVLLLLLFVALNSAGQRKFMSVYKSGVVVYRVDVAEIDSVIFTQGTEIQPLVVSGSLIPVFVQGCSSNALPPAVTTVAELEQLPGSVIIKGGCSGKESLKLTHMDIPYGNCPVTIYRTYSIKDDCYNIASVVQPITLQDTIPSVLSGTLTDITVAGFSEAYAILPVTTVAALEQLPGSIKIQEECTSKDDMIVTSKDTVTSVWPFIINRTYTIRMDCNTTASVVQSIVIKPDSNTIRNEVYIPGGSFVMGSPKSELKYLKPGYDDDERQHEVTVDSFYMSRYEVTNYEFAAFLNDKHIGADGMYAEGMFPDQSLLNFNDSRFEPWGIYFSGEKWIPYPGFEFHPVVFETWYGAVEYAKYVGGRLPTEAEWEYACRAGTTTPFSLSDGYCLTDSDANYDYRFPYYGCQESPFERYITKFVGSYKPNPWGLYNMNGNVGEWCSDWYGPYPETAQINPTGGEVGVKRVVRGGGNSNIASCLRSAYRGLAVPEYGSSTTGFRVAYDCPAVDENLTK